MQKIREKKTQSCEKQEKKNSEYKSVLLQQKSDLQLKNNGSYVVRMIYEPVLFYMHQSPAVGRDLISLVKDGICNN